MEKKLKTAFVCTKCGAIHPRWQGKCRECNEWNGLVEERIISPRRKPQKVSVGKPCRLTDISLERVGGFVSDINEFDRVLGGGLLPASCILLAGEPGIGKSTLILQVADAYSKNRLKVLYLTGEESPSQLKTRAERLLVQGDNISILNLTSLEQILAVLDDDRYHIVIVDSIQTIACEYFDSPPGTIGQIRESAGRLIDKAKKDSFALFLIGHVTKEGMVAGPKVLEHMVDIVLSFEGDSQYLYRLLRPMKNRYGSTQELGVFEMTPKGLTPVENPSSLFLPDFGSVSRSGAVIAALADGNRPILVEIQALVSPASYGTPQRVAGGIDSKRLALLLAILEKRIGIPMGNNDVFVSVAGGLKPNEPAVDLAVVSAIVSSLRDLPISHKTVITGEVGLSGEVRPISLAERRATESAKLGFDKIILPKQNLKGQSHKSIEMVGVNTLEEVLEELF